MKNRLEALRIYQHVIDEVSDALMRSDAKTVASYLARPFHMRTAKGWFPLNTFDDVEQMVSSMHLSLKIQGVTDYVRNAYDAKFLVDGTIEGFHTTHILSKDRPLVPTYKNRMLLKLEGSDWQIFTAEHSIDNAKWPLTMPKVSLNTLSDLEKEIENDAVALTTYQSFLDQLTAANIAGDHAAWNNLCEFPHRVEIDNVRQIVNSGNDTTTFLNTMSTMLNDAIDEEFKREANFAGFLNDDMIRGYHTTSLGGHEGSVFRPIQSRITIRRTNNEWRVIELVNSIANTEFPYEAPMISENLASEFHNPRKDRLQ